MKKSDKTPKFSVLMSVYYKENPEYLNQALESVFNQTLPPNEVVLVEDGPLNEELYTVIKNYKEKYNNKLVSVKLKKNSGLGNALNEGIKHCKYEYIARMDTDDICKKNRFKVQMDFLKNNPHISILGCNVDEYDETMKNKVSMRIVPEKDNDIKNYLKKRNPMNHPTVIFKKESVKNVGFYENYLFFEDYYLWAKLAKNDFKFHNIQESLYMFRTSCSMYGRRGGIQYCKCILNFEKAIYKLKIINIFEFLNNVIKREVGAIIPNNIRTFIYKKFYRN